MSLRSLPNFAGLSPPGLKSLKSLVFISHLLHEDRKGLAEHIDGDLVKVDVDSVVVKFHFAPPVKAWDKRIEYW